jgi:urease accessory protein
MNRAVIRILFAAALFAPGTAFAHTGAGAAHGFLHGLGHPFGGADHMLAMVAVGLIAAQLGGRALWLLPASFLGLMIAGGVAGMAEIRVPYVEAAIALSVIVLGLLVAFRAALPVLLAAAMVGGFALFHGHAHGAELPEGESGLLYAAGFVLATAALHGLGVAAGLGIARLSENNGPRLVRASGAAAALAGVAIMLKAF